MSPTRPQDILRAGQFDRLKPLTPRAYLVVVRRVVARAEVERKEP
jgi:hypothetical protein